MPKALIFSYYDPNRNIEKNRSTSSVGGSFELDAPT